MKTLKYVIIVSAVMVVILLGALFVIREANQNRGDLPLLYELPEFSFTESSGRPFGREDLLGKISVVDFIFTNCPGPCPLMSAEMARFYDLFAGVQQVQFISISVDPNRDSLQSLQAYARKFGVSDQRWLFLRAPIGEIMQLYENGFKLGGMLPADHSTKFILVDQNAVIRGYYDFDDKIVQNILLTHIKELVRKLK